MIDEELKTLRGSVSDFVKKELSKDFVLERDLTINSFSWDIVKKGEDLGYLSMLLSEDDGGQGLDMEGSFYSYRGIGLRICWYSEYIPHS